LVELLACVQGQRAGVAVAPVYDRCQAARYGEHVRTDVDADNASRLAEPLLGNAGNYSGTARDIQNPIARRQRDRIEGQLCPRTKKGPNQPALVHLREARLAHRVVWQCHDKPSFGCRAQRSRSGHHGPRKGVIGRIAVGQQLHSWRWIPAPQRATLAIVSEMPFTHRLDASAISGAAPWR
jgi:hypothetical protein